MHYIATGEIRFLLTHQNNFDGESSPMILLCLIYLLKGEMAILFVWEKDRNFIQCTLQSSRAEGYRLMHDTRLQNIEILNESFQG